MVGNALGYETRGLQGQTHHMAQDEVMLHTCALPAAQVPPHSDGPARGPYWNCSTAETTRKQAQQPSSSSSRSADFPPTAACGRAMCVAALLHSTTCWADAEHHICGKVRGLRCFNRRLCRVSCAWLIHWSKRPCSQR